MRELTEHYRQLLGLDEAWEVEKVALRLEENRVEIRLRHRGGPVACPGCGQACGVHDHADERAWRHLDTMQFETRLVARPPRANCPACGVKTAAVPWAEKHSRFTLLFEAFAIEVLQACGVVGRAAKLLKLDWESMHRILERAVARGLARRGEADVAHLGLDEKSFRRGQSYVSVLTDLDGGRVLEVSEGRDEAAANRLWNSLSTSQKEGVEAVAMDMWQAYANAAATHAPQAEIVHDKFHISKHLNEAVDQVRRTEHKALKREGDSPLTGTRQLWLFNPDNLSEAQWLKFKPLKDLQLKTSRAWAIKEQLTFFWDYRYAGNARKFFRDWYAWASRSRLQPIVKAAKMLHGRLENLLTYFRHRITNAMSEGFNSRIQELKTAARGFRSFANYRVRILFYCGKLDLRPLSSHGNP